MSSTQTRSASLPISSAASIVLHAAFVVTGVATTLIGPILPIFIAHWSLSDQRAGLFFTAQFCGSMVGVASIRWLIGRGYRQAFACGFILIAAGVAGLNLRSNVACLGATFVFGCGLGQALSTGNLWVADRSNNRFIQFQPSGITSVYSSSVTVAWAANFNQYSSAVRSPRS